MKLLIPEEFFEKKIAIDVPPEYFKEFIDAFFKQYRHRTKDNDSLLEWCENKAQHGQRVLFYYHKDFNLGRLTAYTSLWQEAWRYQVLMLDEVIHDPLNLSSIIDLL